MAEDEDLDQKTEEPTPKKLEDAIKKGNLPFSKEIGNFLLLLSLCLMVSWVMPGLFSNSLHNLAPYIQNVHLFSADFDADDIMRLMIDIMQELFAILAIPLMVAIVVALFSNLIQKPLVFTMHPITPRLDKISVFSGLKRLFSMNSVMELVKGLLKIAVALIAIYFSIQSDLGSISTLYTAEFLSSIYYIYRLVIKILFVVTAVFMIISLADLLYQRFEYYKKLRMTKQEIKDEMKDAEGDPHIKSKRRALQQEASQRRMMQELPKANVIITNPTHYSVALHYDEETMDAPVVIAKGVDSLALEIRKIARQHNIPIVENPPLAQGLYKNVDLQDVIPAEYYKPVAEIIFRVM